MYNPLVSVIIPVYKVEVFLPRCLDSIISQSYTHLEIICVNDGSPDRCLQILEEYVEKDARIVVIDQENHGVSSARNNGLSHASGEAVAFIDSDDWIHPQYFELLVDCMIRNHADVVFCKEERTDRKNSFEKYSSDSIIDTPIDMEQMFSTWSYRHCATGRIYKKELLGKHTFPQIPYGEDTVFNLDVLCNKQNIKMYSVDKALYYWFIRQDSAYHSISPVAVLDQTIWYMDHIDQVEKTGTEYFFLIHVIRSALSCRYYLSIEGKDISDVNQMLSELIQVLKQSKFAPEKEKKVLSLMYKLPWLYRTYRDVADPTMIKVEWSAFKKRHHLSIAEMEN